MMKKNLTLIALCFVSAVFLWFCQIRREQFLLAERIAPEILRFHVIANSNSSQDQEIKLKVKSYLLEKIYQKTSLQAPDNPNALPLTKNTLKDFLTTHQKELEKDTEAYLCQLGTPLPVSLEITWCEFPEKTYGQLCLPAGYYEAAQVKIGAAHGHNWWCVLYPKICITKDAAAVVPESSLEELCHLLSHEDYQKLMLQRPELTPKIHTSFYTLEKLKTWGRLFTALQAPPNREFPSNN